MKRLHAIHAATIVAIMTPVAAPIARADLRRACMADYLKFCAGVAPGEGRVARCLQANRASLSGACGDAFAAVTSCRPEIERHCRGVQEPSEIKTCLLKNDAAISETCRRNMSRF
jgi:hypothetical protein